MIYYTYQRGVEMRTLGSRIKFLREKKHLTQTELAEKVGAKTYTTISKWESDENFPKGKDLKILAELFGVSADFLLGIEPSVQTFQTSECHDTDIELPLYGDVAAGALAELESIDVWDVKTVKLPKFLLPQSMLSDKLFAMHVNGDSMDKIIPNGSLIVVKPIEQSLYNDGDIVVFSYNGEYSLKRYRPNAMEGFVLFEADSINPDFKNIPISKSELFEANMYGKVIFCGITF